MPQNFQKAAVALLLCAPSTLHQKWKDNDVAGRDAELARLGFSDAAIAAATTAMPTLRGSMDAFTTVAGMLKTELWAGGEPHPEDPGALKIVQAMRELDGE
jgi:hypothetical protein